TCCSGSAGLQSCARETLALAPAFRISNVSDAQKLAHSARVPAGAGTMWTALINHIAAAPLELVGAGGSLNRTRPSLSVRAESFSAGFTRFMATTRAPASGRFS